MSSTLIFPRPLTLPTKPAFQLKWSPLVLVMSSFGELKHIFSGRPSTVHVAVELSGAIPMRSGVPPGSLNGPFLFHLRFEVILDLDSLGRLITQNKAAKDMHQVETCKVVS